MDTDYVYQQDNELLIIILLISLNYYKLCYLEFLFSLIFPTLQNL